MSRLEVRKSGSPEVTTLKPPAFAAVTSTVPGLPEPSAAAKNATSGLPDPATADEHAKRYAEAQKHPVVVELLKRFEADIVAREPGDTLAWEERMRRG